MDNGDPDDVERLSKIVQEAFRESLPFDRIEILPISGTQREFVRMEDANAFVCELFDHGRQDFRYSYGRASVYFTGNIQIFFELQDPRQTPPFIPRELREQVPDELITPEIMDDYLHMAAMTVLLFQVYKNHVEGRELFPYEFQYAFADSFIRHHPNSRGQGIEAIPDHLAKEMMDMVTEMFIQMANEILDSYPPMLRREIEREYNIPPKKGLDYRSMKFYTDDDFR